MDQNLMYCFPSLTHNQVGAVRNEVIRLQVDSTQLLDQSTIVSFLLRGSDEYSIMIAQYVIAELQLEVHAI